MGARIGRWLNPDPYGIHHSPYLGMANNPINFIDRDGGIPKPLITGAIGAIINAGINAYSQYKDGNLDFSSGKTWARLGVAAGGGFVAGATGNLAVAVAANTVGDVADQLISNGGDISNINYTQSVLAGGTTFLGGAAGGKIANNWVIKHVARNSIRKVMGRNYTNVYGTTVRQYSHSFKQLDKLTSTTTSEVFGGLITGGFTTQVTSGFDIRNFEPPSLDATFPEFGNFVRWQADALFKTGSHNQSTQSGSSVYGLPLIENGIVD